MNNIEAKDDLAMNEPVLPLTRLCGLETEHAMHCDQRIAIPFLSNKKSHHDHFKAIIAQLKKQSPSAPPIAEKRGAFFANGSACWFETIGGNAGLFEACTPECDSPKQLLASSRAVEELLLEATDSLESNDLRLIKNCTDTRNHVYGAQENYEVQAFDPSEADSWNWKIKVLKGVTIFNFLFACILMQLVMGALAKFGLIAGFSSVIAAIMLVWATASLLRGRWVSCTEVFYFTLATSLMPKTIAVSLFYRSTKIGRTYRQLTPFLISRIIFAGAGSIDQKGRYFIGQKARSRNTNSFLSNIAIQNAIFCLNDIFKSLARNLFKQNPGDFSRNRRRLSLAIGDSNMCEESEYLKIATTSLVLDAIEAGAFSETPQLRRTIGSLRKLNSDPTLKAQVTTSLGPRTAIEIQQFYLNTCRRYVESLEDAPEEAFEILRLWSEVLFQLASDPESLFGRIDWITKRALMRRVCDDAGEARDEGTFNEFRKSRQLAALQKVDIKYHEISRDGYYYQLRENGLTSAVISEQQVTQAGRMPPLSTSAAQRSRYIREFGSQIEWVNWDSVKLTNISKPIEFKNNSSNVQC